MLLNTIGSKGVNLAGQIALAWLLGGEEWGAVAMALTVTSFVQLIEQAGLREVLIHRSRRFHRWANAAFWMSVATGLVAGLLLVSLAPMAAKFYGEPQVQGLLLVLAVSAPFNALGIVPDAQLSAQLRFKFLANLGLTNNVAQMVLTVAFAAAGFGAYSFVVPRPIIAVAQTAVLWWVARPRIRLHPQFRRWRLLWGDSVFMLGAAALATAVNIGDYILIGRLTSTESLGLYFFAFRFAIQAVILLTGNLAKVLFPALATLHDDPVRQVQAYLRGAGLLAMLVVPVCVIQAAAADPLVRLVFPGRWYGAIPLAQLLSLAMAFSAVHSTTESLLRAQGRFKTVFRLAVLQCAIFYPLVAAGIVYASVMGVAIAVLIYHVLIGWLLFLVAVRPKGYGGWAYVRCMLRPLAMSVLSAGLGYWLSRVLQSSVHEAVRLLIVVGVGGLMYAFLFRLIAPEHWGSLIHHITALRGRARSSPDRVRGEPSH